MNHYTDMKRYLVFGFNKYYPLGGWKDLVQGFDSLSQALGFAQGWVHEYLTKSQVVDLETGTIMKEFEYAES